METSRIEDQLKALIVERLLLRTRTEEIQDTDDLFKKWNLDSVMFLELVVSLEETFGVSFGDDEFSKEKFRTVKNIADAVRAKKPDA